jgi:hypothetical protein
VTVKRRAGCKAPHTIYPEKRGFNGGKRMSNRKKIERLYHIRYTADFLVPAMSNREALNMADSELTEMVEGDEHELDDIFDITIEKDKFHIIEVVSEDEDDDADDNDENDDDADEGENDDGDDDED